MHDQTAVRTEGIAGLFEQFPEVKAKADAGYRGLGRREDFDETYMAVAGLVSDRAAER